ncbi:MAG: hypothetical protein IPJ69_11980 [Deltaproteobacteria bacterium]|nr:MAG: hypothetical protein IPJ69_11980 [Deltaproteobacteria bacterium]
MIFLGEEGSAGLTSPIGMGQGKFVIKRSPAGEKTVVNEMQNNHLFKDLKKSPTMKSLSLTGKEKLLLMRSSGEVSLDEISGLVRKIVSKK